MQWIISLVTTGGKVNPLAIILLIGTTLVGTTVYFKFTSLLSELELLRQSKVVMAACVDKAEKLNEAQNDKNEARKIIDSGEFSNDYLKRLQNND